MYPSLGNATVYHRHYAESFISAQLQKMVIFTVFSYFDCKESFDASFNVIFLIVECVAVLIKLYILLNEKG